MNIKNRELRISDTETIVSYFGTKQIIIWLMMTWIVSRKANPDSNIFTQLNSEAMRIPYPILFLVRENLLPH